MDNTITERIAEVAANADLGTASARKSGRNPRWPYTPVIVHCDGKGSQRQDKRQVLGKAFETRDEAVAYAERCIARQRELLAEHLGMRGYRALREQYGLPRELS